MLAPQKYIFTFLQFCIFVYDVGAPGINIFLVVNIVQNACVIM